MSASKPVFTLSAILALSLSSPLHAEGDAMWKLERAKLTKMVSDLQADFGETLTNYGKLQEGYTLLLKRPQIPDRSGEVRELQDRLQELNGQLLKRDEISERKMATLQKTLEVDLNTLREELHDERKELLVAKTQLQQLRRFERESAELREKLLEKTADTAKFEGRLEEVTRERDALFGRVEGISRELAETRKSQGEAAKKAQALQAENESLSAKLAEMAGEMKRLGTEAARAADLEALSEKMRAERAGLQESLSARKNELAALKSELAAASESGAKVPELMKERDQLQKDLLERNSELKQAEIALSEAEKSVKLAEELAEARSGLEEQLEKNGEELSQIRGELAESQKLSASSKLLQEENVSLVARQGELVGHIGEVEQGIAQLQNEVARNREILNQPDESDEVIQKLRTEQADLSGELTAALESLNKMEESVISSEAEIETAREKVRMVTAERDGILADLKMAQTKAKQLNKVSEEVQKARSEVTSLKEELSKAGEEKSVLAERAKEQADQLEKLRAELQEKEALKKEVAQKEKERSLIADDLAMREAALEKTRGELGQLHLAAAEMEKRLATIKDQTAKVSPIRYAVGEADVRNQQGRVLAEVKEILSLFPESRFEIEGHTCDLGSAEGNLKLSKERANSLKEFLVEKGMDEERFVTNGVADAEPVAPNTNERNRRKNRRVEIKILD